MKYAEEERLHAKWINVLHTHMKDEKVSFEQTRMTVQAIRTSIGYIERGPSGFSVGHTRYSMALDVCPRNAFL
jgi:hypothetical protein